MSSAIQDLYLSNCFKSFFVIQNGLWVTFILIWLLWSLNVFVFLSHGFSSWKLLCRSGQLWTQRSSCLCLLSAGGLKICATTWLAVEYFNMWLIFFFFSLLELLCSMGISVSVFLIVSVSVVMLNMFVSFVFL